MIEIEIKPFDTLFFKDGKPFEASDNVRGYGIFPPYPSTIYGFVRSVLIHTIGLNPNDWNKIPEINGSIEDCNIYLRGYNLIKQTKSKKEDYVFAPSTFLLKSSSYKDHECEAKFFCPNENGIILYEKDFDEGVGFISFGDFLDLETIRSYKQENITNYTNTIGIKIDEKKKTVEESKIYVSKQIYLSEDFAFKVYIEDNNTFQSILNDPKYAKEGIHKMGGEMRPVYYKISKSEQTSKNDTKLKKIKERIKSKKQFYIVFQTPAIFKNGCLPDFIDPKSNEGIIKLNNRSLNVRIINYHCKKPVYIGGFDIKDRIPKPIYKAIPPGSTYFFKILDDPIDDLTIDALLDKFMFNNVESNIETIQKQGFGFTIIGG